MKKVFFAGLALAMMTSYVTFAQQGKSNYTDDVYYHASQAKQAAEKEAQTTVQQDNAPYNNDESTSYYNSSGDDGYAPDDGQVYSQNAYDDQGYGDYDGYSSRIRRFYYPMSGMGYWGSLYSPYWGSPYGLWYQPGFSFSLGWAPFGTGYWGWNNGYGGGFGFGYPYYSPFYSPFYGYGSYGMGFWNGYYSGLYHGGYYGEGNPYYRNYTYAPRGARNSRTVRNVGTYGNNSRTAPVNRSANTVRPERAAANQSIPDGHKRVNTNTERNSQIHLGNTRVYNNNNAAQRSANSRTIETNRGNSYRNTTPEARPSRNIRNYQSPGQSNYQRAQPAPSRSYSPPARTYQRTTTPIRTNRSYTPTPSRSYSPPARSSSSSGSSSGRSATRR